MTKEGVARGVTTALLMVLMFAALAWLDALLHVREARACEAEGGQYVKFGIQAGGRWTWCIRPAVPLYPDHDPQG